MMRLKAIETCGLLVIYLVRVTTMSMSIFQDWDRDCLCDTDHCVRQLVL